MPTFAQLDECDMDMVVAGTDDNMIMVEGGCREVKEADLVAALEFAMGHIRRLVDAQRQLVAQCGRPKRPLIEKTDVEDLRAALAEAFSKRLRHAIAIPGKEKRQEEIDIITSEAKSAFAERFPEKADFIGKILHDLERAELRNMVLDHNVRADGRNTDQIRPITIEVGTLPRTHGSCLFTRGETQALVVATLGTKADEQRVEELEGQSWKSYMLHYNFPPFSVGEVRPIRGPGRREIGHGALAERAVEPVIPADTHFPYTIRIVSRHPRVERLVVDGLGLRRLDGADGRRRADQVARGRRRDGAHQGRRASRGAHRHPRRRGPPRRHGFQGDGYGGRHHGVPDGHQDRRDFVRDHHERAREGAHRAAATSSTRWRQTLSQPRAEMSPFAPRITILHIHPDKIREVIGPGGKMIKKITEETGCPDRHRGFR